MQISSSFGQLQLAVTGATRLNVTFDEKEEVRPENGKTFEGISAGVHIEDIHFSLSSWQAGPAKMLAATT